MKALTVKQPWASIICSGIKDIENRTWNTKFRGRVLIHASAAPCTKKQLAFSMSDDCRMIWRQSIENGTYKNNVLGSVIGSVEIVNVISVQRDGHNSKSIWAEKGCYNWVLRNPILFDKPIPAKGKLSFWDYPNILAEPEEKNGELFCHCQLSVKEEDQVTGDSRFGFYCRYCGGKWYK